MNLAQILSARTDLVRQARLANLALAYARLSAYAQRFTRARMTGLVCLEAPAPECGRYLPILSGEQCRQSVIEEHFTDEDLLELSDELGLALSSSERTFTFRIETFAATFLDPLARELEHNGIELHAAPTEQRP